MFFNNSVFKSLVVAALFVVTASGCVKKRSDRASFGSGLETGDTVPKSSLDNKTYKLVTAGKVADGNNTFAQKLTVESDATFMNNMSFVSYTTDAPLLGPDIMIKAVENNSTDYSLLYKVEGSYLKIYKVGPKNLIPSSEWTYATDMGSDRLAVPLVSYSLTHMNLRKVTNEDGRETNVITEIPVTDSDKIASATHVRVNTLERVPFKALDKQDVFNKEMFLDGVWQFSIEVVELADDEDGGEMLGFIGTGNRGGRRGSSESIKLKFKAQADRLIGENLNINASMAKKDENYKEVLTLPIKEWFNFKVLANKSGKDIEETNLKTDSDRTKLPYLQVDFEKMSCFCTNPGGPDYKFDELIISKNLVSWVLKTKKTKVRYNLYKPQINAENYIARPYPYGDERRFGAINTFTDYDMNDVSQNDINYVFSQRKLVRLAPGQVVEYHATGEGADLPWVDEVATHATQAWNRVFAHVYKDYKDANGKPVPPPRVVYSTKRVAKGDPRYYKINMTGLNNIRTAGGIGNPHYDPTTGQIYSATSHMYVGIYKYLATDIIRNYIYAKLGAFNSSLVTGLSNTIYVMRDENNIMGDMNTAFGGISLLPNTMYGEKATDFKGFSFNWSPQYNENSAEALIPGQPVANVLAKLNLDPKTVSPEQAMSVFQQQSQDPHGSHSDMHQSVDTFVPSAEAAVYIVESQCPDVKSAIQKAKESVALPILATMNFDACVTQLVKQNITSSLMHEMGHNFGLAHNFYGSADAKNYPTEEFIKTVYGDGFATLPEKLVLSSSIMDYSFYYNPVNPILGPYDVAAIRYIYTGKVEMNDGAMQTVITGVNKDLRSEIPLALGDVMDATQKQLKVYKYCDNDDLYTNKDPMCAQFDYGSSPKEIVKNLIKDYDAFIELSKYRHNQFYSYNEYRRMSKAMSFHFARLKRFYDQWRINLMEMVGKNDMYLEKYDEKTWIRVLGAITGPDNFVNKNISEYYKVRTLIYNFFKREALSLNHYCKVVVTRQDKQKYVDYIEFSKARDLLRVVFAEQDYHRSASCLSPEMGQVINQYYTESSQFIKSASVQGEIGDPLNSYHYSLDPLEGDKPFDVVGNRALRIMALYSMVVRVPISITHINTQFYPNMLDEPDIRGDLREVLVDRIINGVRIDRKSADEEIKSQFAAQAIKVLGPKLSQGMTADNMFEDPLVSMMYREVDGKKLQEEQKSPDESNIFYGGRPAFVKFDEEKDTIAQMFRLYIVGLPVPGKIDTTKDRLLPFMSIPVPSYYGQMNNLPNKIDMGQYYLIPREEAYVAAQLVQKHNQITNIVDGHLIDPEKFVKFIGEIMPRLAKEAQGAKNSDSQVGANPPQQDLTVADLMKVHALFLERVTDKKETNFTVYEKNVMTEAFTNMVNTMTATMRVVDPDSGQEVPVGKLFMERNRSTQTLNQLGSMGDGLNQDQRDLKNKTQARIQTLERVVKENGDKSFTELFKTLNKADFSWEAVAKGFGGIAVDSNRTQIDVTMKKGELNSQKELIKIIFTSI